MDFTIDEKYLTQILEHTEWNHYARKKNPTEEDLIHILNGDGITKMTQSVDHPEFTKLREELSDKGYISITRGVWNADRVLKKFTFNGFLLNKGDTFYCAAAMPGFLRSARKRQSKTLR